jgi:hypothetical protein
MANPALLPFISNIGRKNVKTKKTVLLYIAIDILIWVSLMAGTRTESSNCSVECYCLGAFVDCSKRGLTKVPSDVPDWVEIL